MVAIIDYGVGNLFSLECSFKAVGAEVFIASSADDIKKADRLILPGVGAFGDAIKKLFESGLGEVIKQQALAGKPLLGICLGMQLLFDGSAEYGSHAGLGLIPGRIEPIADSIKQGLKIPHIGWNSLEFKKPESRIFKYIKNGDYVYFVHSFHAVCDAEYISSTADYGGELTASVERENIFGCQFHPEKSGETGLNLLRAFCEIGG